MSTSPGPPDAVNWMDGQYRPIVFVTIIIAIMMLGGALKHLGRATVPLGEMLRWALSALAVAILLVGALALLAVALATTVGSE
ncbi:hypothetical protein [Mangrovihabitans endophyticus]|uniref:hypothetical protein n=1 Tax=Mangrovihabitans endophyticus TaxID=1751298 RepID=UPI00166BD71C|nr:hypothetical protein [Mangrovihabitans endophyticus]